MVGEKRYENVTGAEKISKSRSWGRRFPEAKKKTENLVGWTCSMEAKTGVRWTVFACTENRSMKITVRARFGDYSGCLGMCRIDARSERQNR